MKKIVKIVYAVVILSDEIHGRNLAESVGTISSSMLGLNSAAYELILLV